MFDFIQNIDISVIEKIYSLQHNLNSELFNKIMIFFTILGDNGMIWIAVALILFLNRKYRKIGVFSIVSLIICALAVNVILKPLIHRPRPFSELADITLLIKAPKDYSFPSGHTEIFYTCTHYRNTHCFFENVSKCAFSQRYYCRNYNRYIFRICRRKTYRRVLQKKD